MERAISKIVEYNLTKQQIHDFVQQVSEDALSGNYDLLELKRSLKVLSDIVSGIEENLSGHILDEASKHGKSFEYHGARYEIKIRNTPDYNSDDRVKELNTKLKERKNFLKNLTSPVADPETGEIINPVPFKSTEYLTVKL